jgi:hypothetical protein
VRLDSLRSAFDELRPTLRSLAAAAGAHPADAQRADDFVHAKARARLEGHVGALILHGVYAVAPRQGV